MGETTIANVARIVACWLAKLVCAMIALALMSNEASPPTWKHTAKFVALPLLGFVLMAVNDLFPFVRLNNDLANFVVGTLSLLLPFVAATFALIIPRRWLTSVILLVLLLPLLFLSAFFLLVDGFLIRDAFRMGGDPAFKRVANVPMDGYSVGLFVNDCGAPCGIGIDLFQERSIIRGILLVRALLGFDDADSASYKVIGDDTLQVDVPAFVDSDPRGMSIPAQSRVYHLKRFLYF